jgi:hypothetical protein
MWVQPLRLMPSGFLLRGGLAIARTLVVSYCRVTSISIQKSRMCVGDHAASGDGQSTKKGLSALSVMGVSWYLKSAKDHDVVGDVADVEVVVGGRPLDYRAGRDSGEIDDPLSQLV